MIKISFMALTKVLLDAKYTFIVEKSPFFKEKDVWVFLVPKPLSVVDIKITYQMYDGEYIREKWEKYQGEPILHYDVKTGTVLACTLAVDQLVAAEKRKAADRLYEIKREENAKKRTVSIFNDNEEDLFRPNSGCADDPPTFSRISHEEGMALTRELMSSHL